MKLVLYSTLGCHLCETAKALLLELAQSGAPGLAQFSVTEVDIADDDTLFARYGVRIPVLKIDDQNRELGWPFDLQQLYQFLSAN